MIKDTESLFKSREKEYQDTIDQIEVKSFCLCPNIYMMFFLYSTKHIIAFYQARPTTLRDVLTISRDLLKDGKGASSRRDSCKM